MRRNLLLGLSASALVAWHVNATGSNSPALTMVSQLGDAIGKCQELSMAQYSQEYGDSAINGSQRPALDAIADASSNRALNDSRYDACLATARDTGRAAYETYQSASGDSQTIREDVRTVYTTWLAALPALTKMATPKTPVTSELLAYRKALAVLRADGAAR